MTAEQMLYEFELSADKVSSKSAMNLPLPAKVAYLNRGQRSFVINTYNGFERSRYNTDSLRILVVPNEKLKVKKENEKLYSGDLTGTKETFLILLRHTVYASKGKCQSVKVVTKETQLDDLEEALLDPFRRPDFQWREALMTTADDRLFIHTDGFVVDSIEIDYLRMPKAIDVSGYTRFDNSASTDVACELPEIVHDRIVEEAVFNLRADLGEAAYQTAAYKLQKSQQIP